MEDDASIAGDVEDADNCLEAPRKRPRQNRSAGNVRSPSMAIFYVFASTTGLWAESFAEPDFGDDDDVSNDWKRLIENSQRDYATPKLIGAVIVSWEMYGKVCDMPQDVALMIND